MDSIRLLWISFFRQVRSPDDNGYDETKADEESMSPWLLGGTNSKLWLLLLRQLLHWLIFPAHCCCGCCYSFRCGGKEL
jgi:hypothetical protein